MSCTRLWEVDALRDGRLGDDGAAAHERHRLQCAECSSRHEQYERFVELGRAPMPKRDELGVRRLRASILREAATPAPPSSRRGVGIAVTVAIAAVAITLVVFIAVGRGSADITAEEALPARRRDRADEHVKSDDNPTALEDSHEVSNIAAPPRTGRSTTRADASGDDATAAAYETAVDTYRQQRWAEAATLLQAFVGAHPEAREAEDAFFLEANALAHSGQSDAAASIAERFLVRYPTSFHALDAAILVARAAREHGDCARARTVLAPWSGAHAREVTAALDSCDVTEPK